MTWHGEMLPFPFAIVGFDLDGTLLDTSGDLASAVNHALAADGRPALSTAQVVSMVGGGTHAMLARALAATGGNNDAALDRLLPIFSDFYATHLAVETRPYPGAVAALDALARRGATLAIVTNKREGFVRPLLDRFDLTTRFATIIGGDTPPGILKPDPAPIRAMIAACGGGRAAFVGDTAYDVRAARGAGIPVIAWRFGFSGDEVDELDADAVIDRFDDLLPALERL